MEGKTNFSGRLKQFDGLTWLTLTPVFYDRSAPLIVTTGQRVLMHLEPTDLELSEELDGAR